MTTHVLVRNEDGSILESKGSEAAEKLVAAMGDTLKQETFILRPPDKE